MIYSIENLSRSLFCNAINKNELLTRKIVNRIDVNQAVYDVYNSKSIIARRMSGRASINVNPILDHISYKIFFYFNGTPNKDLNQINYDKFLYELCDYFKKEYDKLAENAKINKIEFGIAQKLINMVFKYLSCYEDYMVFADLFIYCHMPIDSYVLHYFNTMNIVSEISSHFSITMISPTATYRGSTWSNLSKEKYEILVTEYRKTLEKSYTDYTSLHAEYYIWQMVKSRSIGTIIFGHSPSLPGSKKMFNF
jgi:hypothetical protein